MPEYSFFIPGKPTPLKRPRFSKDGHCYDSQKAEKARDKKVLMSQIRSQGMLKRFKGPISIDLAFHMPLTKIEKKKGFKLIPYPKIPDIDNLCKFILDVMNGFIFDDDKLIVMLTCKKVACETPGTYIKIKNMELNGEEIY